MAHDNQDDLIRDWSCGPTCLFVCQWPDLIRILWPFAAQTSGSLNYSSSNGTEWKAIIIFDRPDHQLYRGWRSVKRPGLQVASRFDSASALFSLQSQTRKTWSEIHICIKIGFLVCLFTKIGWILQPGHLLHLFKPIAVEQNPEFRQAW